MAIGDSFHHDVVGGAGFGLATALVTGGIHHADFAGATDKAGRLKKLADIAEDQGLNPDWVIPWFRW